MFNLIFTFFPIHTPWIDISLILKGKSQYVTRLICKFENIFVKMHVLRPLIFFQPKIAPVSRFASPCPFRDTKFYEFSAKCAAFRCNSCRIARIYTISSKSGGLQAARRARGRIRSVEGERSEYETSTTNKRRRSPLSFCRTFLKSPNTLRPIGSNVYTFKRGCRGVQPPAEPRRGDILGGNMRFWDKIQLFAAELRNN